MHHTEEQHRFYAINSMHGALFGYEAYFRRQAFEAEFSRQHPRPVNESKVTVVTNLGNTLEIILRPTYLISSQVVGYPFDKNEGVYVVVKGSKRPKVARETFKWNTEFWYKNNAKSLSDAYNQDVVEWGRQQKLYVQERVLKEILAEVPDAEEYLAMTPENAEEKLKEKGWTIPPGISFERFMPGNWLDHPSAPYRNNCSAGVDNDMKYDTKTIVQTGWSSDD